MCGLRNKLSDKEISQAKYQRTHIPTGIKGEIGFSGKMYGDEWRQETGESGREKQLSSG